MPPGGVENRSEQLALVAGLLHDRGTDPRLGELLAAVEGSDLLADPGGARRGQRARRSAGSTTGSSGCRARWSRTSPAPPRWPRRPGPTPRGASDFARFRPWLERIVALKRARGRVRGVCRRAVRRAARGLRARTPERGRAAGCSRRSGRELVPLAARIAGAPRRPGRGGAAPPLPARPPAPLRRGGRRRRRLRLRPRPHGPRRPPLLHRHRARATAGSPCGSTTATSPAACSPSSTRSATGCTSRASTRSTTARRWARRRRSAWTRRRPGSGRTGSAGTAGFWEHFYPQRARALPREPGRRPARRVPLRGEPGGAVADPGPGRRGDLQPARHDPLRSRARAGLGRARRGRPARGLERGLPRDARRRAAHRRRGLPAGRPLGRRDDRLLPDLHAGRRVRGAALRRAPSWSWAAWASSSPAASSRRWWRGSAGGCTGRAAAIRRRG